MKIKEKIMLEHNDFCEHGPVNIVVLGDSVSQGSIIHNLDYENVYHNRLRKMLNAFRDVIPVNVINSAIGGTTAEFALNRLDNGVFNHNPDLVIVCFGLNDVSGEIEVYLNSLETIFTRCKENGCDAIFMTPNMLNTYVAEDTLPDLAGYAKITAEIQNSGRMDRYIYEAVKLAENMGITVCDCYSEWKKIAEKEDTTMLLANRINHPIPEMHKLFADKLYEIIMK